MRRLSLALGLVFLLASSAVAQDKWGTIKGRIIWGEEKIPQRDDLTPIIQKNPAAAMCLKDGKVLSDAVVINEKNHGMRWVMLWLSDGNPMLKKKINIHPKLKDADKEPLVIDQPLCMYIPHAIALREGQTLLVKNSASFPHNVLYLGPDGNGNPLLQSGQELALKNLTAKPAPTTLSCAIHPWMKAYVRIFDHPYYAVTDKDGRFEIKDAPAGKLNLIVWHPTLGFRFGAIGRPGTVIDVHADQVKDLGDLKFPPPK